MPESIIPLLEGLIVSFYVFRMYSFPILGVMPRVYIVLHLPVTHDNFTRQISMTTINLLRTHITFCRSLQLIIRWLLQITLDREEVSCIAYKFWKDSKVDCLHYLRGDIPWDPGISTVFCRDESLLPFTCTLFELLTTTADPSRKPVLPPSPWFRSDTRVPAPRPPPWLDWDTTWMLLSRGEWWGLI